MTLFIKYFTALFFTGYLMAAFVWPSIRTYKQTGINPITFGRSDNAHDFIGKWFKVLLALIPLSIAVFCISSRLYAYLLPAEFLSGPVLQWSGIVLCLLSLAWTITAQWQMGKSWRIGIDEKHQTELVQSGLFSVSRNPIFLGMQVTLLGFFFILPNAVTLLVLVAGYLLIQIQVRLEEDYLSGQHGESYYQYQKSVAQFI